MTNLTKKELVQIALSDGPSKNEPEINENNLDAICFRFIRSVPINPASINKLSAECRTEDVYEVFREWCSVHDYPEITRNYFVRRLKRLFASKRGRKDGYSVILVSKNSVGRLESLKVQLK